MPFACLVKVLEFRPLGAVDALEHKPSLLLLYDGPSPFLLSTYHLTLTTLFCAMG